MILSAVTASRILQNSTARCVHGRRDVDTMHKASVLLEAAAPSASDSVAVKFVPELLLRPVWLVAHVHVSLSVGLCW